MGFIRIIIVLETSFVIPSELRVFRKFCVSNILTEKLPELNQFKLNQKANTMFFGGRGGFPFGDFEEMGGMPGRGGPPKEVDNTKFYKILGVDKNADYSAIKKAYFKLARTHHPDRGGDKDKFQEI